MAQAAPLQQVLTLIAPVWHVVATQISHLVACRLRVWFSEAQLASASSLLDLGIGGCGQQAEQGCKRAHQ
jgi:hypothetical protein